MKNHLACSLASPATLQCEGQQDKYIYTNDIMVLENDAAY
jgi:hypothetical protein